ncbi:synaptopodin-2-like isoform X3 [Leucoraja erinacea]|uniref:synaptopodin-2-like isoform X3 n=1 Tax=Leucoraja erinaceus TaxID=7782 RepID=UPI002458A5C8|nr:synaptopodin-2-like isoform X3 [Leucoraja erinacea]
MGIGDYVCITIDGGPPWGFRLQGGKEHKQPLQISKVRKKSKACNSGLCEGDELISINSKSCSELTHSEAMQLIDGASDTLQILIKRSISEKADEPQYTVNEETRSRETVETTLQIAGRKASAKQNLPFELYISESQDEAYYGETESDTDVSGKREERQSSSRLLLKECGSPGELLLQGTCRTEQRRNQHSGMVEFQVSIAQGMDGGPETSAVTVTGLDKINSATVDENLLQKDNKNNELAASETDENAAVQIASATKLLQSKIDKKVKLVDSEVQMDSYQSRMDLFLDSSDREYSGKEASTSEVGSGCADSQAEEGWSKTDSTPPFPIGISSEGTEHGSEGTHSGKDLARTHKHRARQAKIRRSESLSEKQVKEAKSKCKSIALLLTATPTPSSKGALMFKKRRQRAKKYTLVSYGTGEFDPDDDQEDSIEFTLIPTSDSDLDEDFCADVNSAQVVTFDWDIGLVEVEKKEKSEKEMQRLPDTKGKGALLFAKRRQRIDQYTAEQEEMKRAGASEVASAQCITAENYYQTSKSSVNNSTFTIQNHTSENYVDVSKFHGIDNVKGVRGRSKMVHQNVKAPEDNRAGATNRTATPFPGVSNRAAAPFSPTRRAMSSMSDLPPPPSYSSINQPPADNIYHATSPPLVTNAQPAIWAPTGIAGEQIASRDERICVPAIRTGILQDARKRNTAKPMFTFIDRPKVAPNPELLSMVKGPSINQANTASADEEYTHSSGRNVFVPPGYTSYAKQESSALSVAMAPRPKFSARKTGVTAQMQARDFRPIKAPEKLCSGAQAMRKSATNIPDTSFKKVTPWDAASQSVVGSVEEAFSKRNIQSSIAKNIVSAARRKTLPEPPEEWKARVAYVPPLPSSYSSLSTFNVRRPSSITSSLKSSSTPVPNIHGSSMHQQPLSYQQSLTDSDMSTGAYSDYESSSKQVAGSNYNPYPRGWKKQR